MMQVPNTPTGKKFIEKLKKPAKERKLKEDLATIPGAMEVLEKLRKEVAAFEQRMRTVESRTEKLWVKKIQENIRRNQDVHKDTEKC